MKKGKFIVFEGLDGSGKTTQAQLLVKKLKARDIPALYTREPSDSLPGSVARSVIRRKTVLQNESLALLFLADRIEHIETEIVPALAQGRTVVSDRYYLSNITYQGLEMDRKLLFMLNEMLIMERLLPDATIFLDVSPERCGERIGRDRLNAELFEEINKQSAIRKHFFELFDMVRERERVLVIESEDDMDATSEKIWNQIEGVIL